MLSQSHASHDERLVNDQGHCVDMYAQVPVADIQQVIDVSVSSLVDDTETNELLQSVTVCIA